MSEVRWPAGGSGQSPRAEMTVRTVTVDAMIAINKPADARNAIERVAIGAVGVIGEAAFAPILGHIGELYPSTKFLRQTLSDSGTV